MASVRRQMEIHRHKIKQKRRVDSLKAERGLLYKRKVKTRDLLKDISEKYQDTVESGANAQELTRILQEKINAEQEYKNIEVAISKIEKRLVIMIE